MSKRFYIHAISKPVSWLVAILMLPVWPIFGQDTVSIGGQLHCENNEALVPVNVSGFYDVAAFTFYITIDTLAVEFVDIENPNAQLGGQILSNFVGSTSQIIIAWSSMAAVNLNNEKLFDLKMVYHDGPAGLVFTDACEIVLSDLTIVGDAVYEDGLLIPAIQVTQQPLPASVTEGQQAHFSIALQNSGPGFHWQQNTGSGWSNLEDEAPYSGVSTSQLTIDDVSMAFDSFAYRCQLQFDDCNKISDSVNLTVSPLAVAESGNPGKALIEVYPNPCMDHLYFKVNTTEKDFGIQLVNLLGGIVCFERPLKCMGSISVMNLDPGIYFLQMIKNNQTRETVKVMIR